MLPRRLESGVKAYQRADDEWREQEYFLWHRTLSRRALLTNADGIEWRFHSNGQLVPVAVTEITRADAGRVVDDHYLGSIVDRYNRQFQGRAVRELARRLGCAAYIVLFRQGLDEFWVYDLNSGESRWQHLDPIEMGSFVEAL